MSKTTVFAALCLILAGCSTKEDPISGQDYNETIIEGHQYIWHGHWFGHKGNCTNEIHPENWGKE